MTRPRTSGAGRRFELVLMRLNPPTPRTLAVIAKHASAESYHWLLVAGRAHSGVENLARLLAVAYLDEASGLLGRGDPRWAVPRAYLRPGGEVETRERPRWDDPGMPPFVRRELSRIAAWLLGRHRAYVESLSRALRLGEGEEGFRRLTSAEARRRGFSDPTGRSLLAPDPPPIVTRTRADEGEHGGRADSDEDTGPGWRLPWRRFAAGRRPGPSR
ncbi:MAG TPA: hypothetical protein VKB18_05595 [Gemmatimonadota bacterium]|nr:hypothetical protein [Gemmatimonadota bacterium]